MEFALRSAIISVLIKASDVLKTPLDFLDVEVKYSFVTNKMEYTFYDVTGRMLLHIHGLEELEKVEA